ncbi:unnamed protein product [Vitrella brassicaformis CCMP3155]|uniref:rRNA-processing protein FYV7 n=1 Tax=Vitrella brassicaformis (strain CCMP3155) TaxID=1169540 RepID=A0A0G4E9G5_VITBC|nr:unnamed protein product [Vitrella brassicaformis CCMP3155]|eukprot:CEL91869.1 unnamed protein product [Vitrella brassicaformis CCMP3155]
MRSSRSSKVVYQKPTAKSRGKWVSQSSVQKSIKDFKAKKALRALKKHKAVPSTADTTHASTSKASASFYDKVFSAASLEELEEDYERRLLDPKGRHTPPHPPATVDKTEPDAPDDAPVEHHSPAHDDRATAHRGKKRARDHDEPSSRQEARDMSAEAPSPPAAADESVPRRGRRKGKGGLKDGGKGSAYAKAIMQLNQRKAEEARQREEREKERREREQRHKESVARRNREKKLLYQKTRKGQPVMKGLLTSILNKVDRTH